MVNKAHVQPRGLQHFLRKIDTLYNGKGKDSNVFRWSLLAFDAITILYFVIASLFHQTDSLHWIEVAIGVIYLGELLLRLAISHHRVVDIVHPTGLADIIVITSLLLPALAENFSFLRVLRSLRLLRSYHMLRSLRKQSNFVRLHEDVLFSIVNLMVFIFVITAVVYVSQVAINPAISDYVDALYFTISTLTTTGFGDITLIGTGGHILAVLIMIFGISLFVRLIQTIFQPRKITYECPACGLKKHEIDAIHCKHCGQILHITTDGSN
jgi:voltage-gated potassium channel